MKDQTLHKNKISEIDKTIKTNHNETERRQKNRVSLNCRMTANAKYVCDLNP